MHQSNSEDSSCNCELLADPVRVHFIRFKGAQSQSFMIVLQNLATIWPSVTVA